MDTVANSFTASAFTALFKLLNRCYFDQVLTADEYNDSLYLFIPRKGNLNAKDESAAIP